MQINEKALKAGARKEAEIDGRDFDALGRADKQRYIDRLSAAIRAYLEAATPPDVALPERFVEDYAEGYELRADDDYRPTDGERAMLVDFGHGLLGEVEDRRRNQSKTTPADVAGLCERLNAFAVGCRGSMWQSREETIRLCEQAATALRLSAGGGWRTMDSAPKDGTRILLAWKPFDGLSEHVELGKWKARQGWSNTYGHPFNGEPDAWAPLAPFASPTVEAGHVE